MGKRKIRAKLAFVMQWKKFYPLVRFLGAVVIAVLVTKFPMNFIEGALYDARVRMSPPTAISNEIATVAIDSKTSSDLNHEPTFRDQTWLLNQILGDGPKNIIMLGDPTKWEGTPEEKQEFIKLQNPKLFFATDQIYGKLKFQAPFDALNLVSAPITRDNITFAGDKVTRRLIISFEDQLTLQALVAQTMGAKEKNLRGTSDTDGSKYSYIHFSPSGTFRPLSFIDVRDGRFPKGAFTGKTVIIGNDNNLNSEDYIQTPYSRDPLAMSRLEAHANIINTLLQNNGYVKAQSWLDFVFTLLVSYITVLVVWAARPARGIFILFTQAVTFFLISYLLFALFGVWINAIHPLVAIFVCYYFFIPYRLIVENKRSWEFQQKNRLLTQVEELKTNFISMMSHDLKTPIARIQGMAEIALNDSTKLAPHQKEALKTIMQSSEELNGFVGSILDLSRIEGKEMKLHKTSKDVNAVINEVIKKYEFSAKSKGITLKAELETLFSIRVDVDLIRQVIANLVENAIKYTAENTTVTVSSHEVGGQIIVTVEDQGRGIPQDEIDNIFLKFYRSREAKASSTKGSGLGLYLAKYFVELHNGQIAVESEPEKGSKFTVQLPL